MRYSCKTLLLICPIIACLLCDVNTKCQTIIPGEAIKFIDLIETDGAFVLVTSSSITDTTYYQRYHLLDANLNVNETSDFYFENLIGINDQAHGKLHMKDGEIWMNGLANKVNYSNPLGTGDSCYFYTLRFNESLSLLGQEAAFLKLNWNFSEAEVVDEDGISFIAYDGVQSFSLARKNWSESPTSSANVSVTSGFFFFNPDRQFTLFRGDGLYGVRAGTTFVQFFDEALNYDSLVNLVPGWQGSPNYGYAMSGSIIDLGASYLSFSATEILGPVNIFNETPYVIELSKENEFIQEFWFENPDSSVAGSNFENLALATDGSLYIGMHIQSNQEDYAKHLKLIKSDLEGNLIWQRVIGEGLGNRYMAKKTIATADGGVLIAAERFTDPISLIADGIIIYYLNALGELTTVQTNNMNSFSFYPNPASEFLRVNMADASFQNGVLDIYDSLGKSVSSSSVSATMILDVSSLGKGVYTVVLTTDQGSSAQKLILH